MPSLAPEHLLPAEMLPVANAAFLRCSFLIQPIYHLSSGFPSFLYLRETDGVHEPLDVLEGHIPRIIDARKGKLWSADKQHGVQVRIDRSGLRNS